MVGLVDGFSSGLITPLLRDVDKLGLVGLNTQIKELVSRSKAGKLLPEEYAVREQAGYQGSLAA